MRKKNGTPTEEIRTKRDKDNKGMISKEIRTTRDDINRKCKQRI